MSDRSCQQEVKNRRDVLIVAAFAAAGGILAGSHWTMGIDAQATEGIPEPWTPAQALEPGDLVKELAGPSATRPTVVCVGVPALYRAGHVPGASLHGPASSSGALTELKQWTERLPRTTKLVLYCGCCPFATCPNVRPAFTALRDMGFTHLRVVRMPSNFATDWAAKDYPIER